MMLNSWPMRSPTDASPPPLRTATHGSGPIWIATPSSYRTYIDCSLPVSRRTAKHSGHYSAQLRLSRFGAISRSWASICRHTSRRPTTGFPGGPATSARARSARRDSYSSRYHPSRAVLTRNTRKTICAFPALAGVLASNAPCYEYPAQWRPAAASQAP